MLGGRVRVGHRAAVGLGLYSQIGSAEARKGDRVSDIGELERDFEVGFHGWPTSFPTGMDTRSVPVRTSAGAEPRSRSAVTNAITTATIAEDRTPSTPTHGPSKIPTTVLVSKVPAVSSAGTARRQLSAVPGRASHQIVPKTYASKK